MGGKAAKLSSLCEEMICVCVVVYSKGWVQAKKHKKQYHSFVGSFAFNARSKGIFPREGLLLLNPSRPQCVLQAQASPFEQGIITGLSP